MAAKFRKAYGKLSKGDAAIVRETVTKLAGWVSTQSFYDKMNGKRPISDRNEKNKNEEAIIESSFRAFGINAWTGETIKATMP